MNKELEQLRKENEKLKKEISTQSRQLWCSRKMKAQLLKELRIEKKKLATLLSSLSEDGQPVPATVLDFNDFVDVDGVVKVVPLPHYDI